MLIATIISIPAALAWLIASTVCGITPSSAATTKIAISVDCAPRIRIDVNASCPGVSRNVIVWSLIFTTEAPICCVIPPASPEITFVSLIASRSDVLPWSTCPITQTTGGRLTISDSSSSSSLRSSSIMSTFSSFSHMMSYPKAISSALSKSISVLTVTIFPSKNNFLISVDAVIFIFSANSPIVIASGT